jgi:hypothetical protein
MKPKNIMVLQDLDLDFCWSLKQAINWQKFMYMADCDYDFCESTQITQDSQIPVGSVQFVHDALYSYFKLPIPKPINIPAPLFREHSLHPKIIEGPCKFNKTMFIKSMDEIKHPDNGPSKSVKEGRWQVTDYLDNEFDSEWRIFVFKGEVVGVAPYSGDYFLPPSMDYIKEHINAWGDTAPIAYTLDYGVLKNWNVLIEAHNFYSCGLYGFRKWNLLPQMFSGWWKEYVRKRTKDEKND